MIGKQKRPLEHTVSSQPVKYQKHFDDNLCEVNTRVTSLTEEQPESQKHLSGASQTNPFSVYPGASCDLTKVCDRALTSVLHGDKVSLELENGVHLDPHDGGILSEANEAVRIADDPCVHAKESKIECHEDDKSHSFAVANETQGIGQLMADSFTRGTDPCLSSLGTSSLNEKRGEGLLDSTSSELPSPLLQGAVSTSIPSTGENTVEDDTFLETAQKAFESRCPNGSSRPLPVLMSEKVIDLDGMHKRVESFGGYQTVTSEGLWGNISEDLNLGPDCGPGLKLIYFRYLNGLEKDGGLLTGGHCDIGLAGTVTLRVRSVANEKTPNEKYENFPVVVGEEFAESEPFHEKSVGKVINGGSSYVKREDGQEVGHFDVETGIGYIRKERELATPQAQCKADGDNEPKVTQCGSSFLGSVTHANVPAADLSDSGLLKGHTGYSGTKEPKISQGDSDSFVNCSFAHECNDIPTSDRLDKRLVKGHQGQSGTGVKQVRELGKNIEELDKMDEAALERNKSLLIWIKRMALEPGNPLMGQGLEGTGQNEDWVMDCALRADKLRALIWKRRDEMRPGDAHLHQAKHILSPSLYYEENVRPEQQALERLRTTRERIAHYGSPLGLKSLHESGNFLQRGSLAQPQWVGQPNHRLPRQSHYYNEERYSEDLFLDRPRKRGVPPIGPDFQCHIPPQRTADHSGSVVISGRSGPNGDETQSSVEDDYDSRLVGQLIWPPPGYKRVGQTDRVGLGRPDFCSCPDPESLDCVRLHILEARDRLKEDLGSAFYVWKLDQMGESVAESWTKEEEQMFRALVKMNPPSRNKNFWTQLPDAFPGKKMRELVSYYFNVFVLRRRAIQNRLDPKHVDSDDDETDLPEGDSEDTDEYESGEEVDEDADEDISDYEDEKDKENDPYEGNSASKLLLGVVNSVEDESEGVPVGLCSTSLMNLGDIEQGYHDPGQDERRGRLPSDKWTPERHDHDKHLEEHVSIVGEEELQEVKTWEVSHWDEADHEDLVCDPAAKGASSKDEQLTLLTERDPCPYKKVVDGTSQHTFGSCEGEVWGVTLDIAPRKEEDKLLSTNGMIQEFFGDEAPGSNSSS